MMGFWRGFLAWEGGDATRIHAPASFLVVLPQRALELANGIASANCLSPTAGKCHPSKRSSFERMGMRPRGRTIRQKGAGAV
jgi:hypothetical protein